MPTVPMDGFEKPLAETTVSPLVLASMQEKDIFEAYRVARGLRAAEMARELNVSRQRLYNWLEGVSIPEQLWVMAMSKREDWVGDLARDLRAKRIQFLTSVENKP